MAFATLNGSPVLRGEIGIPRVGAWHADLAVDATEEIDGPCTLSIENGLTLVGTAYRTGVWLDTAKLRIVGGAGGLRTAAKPQHYRKTRLRAVLLDILATAGEALAGNSSESVLATSFPHWTTIGQTCGQMLSALLEDDRMPADVAWRIFPDGTLWVGVDTWPDSGLSDVVDYQVLEESPADGRLDLGIEAPLLQPGVTLAGQRVSYVEHSINGATARTRVLVQV